MRLLKILTPAIANPSVVPRQASGDRSKCSGTPCGCQVGLYRWFSLHLEGTSKYSGTPCGCQVAHPQIKLDTVVGASAQRSGARINTSCPPPIYRPSEQSTTYPASFLKTHYSLIILSLLLSLLTACSTSMNQPTITHTTSTPATSGGERVLPHSQIHFQDAPRPTTNDLRFDNGDWTLAGHDAASTRSFVFSFCCSAAAPAPLWYHSLGTPLLYAPVVGNGHIYLLGTDGYLHVLNAQTGEEQWRVSVGGELTSNGLALAHDRIYLALAGHFIAALDANTGQEQWRIDTGGVMRGAPLVVGRELLVASGPNSLWCLDALTGAKYWVFHSEDTLAQFWPTRTTPAVGDGVIYVALGASNEFNALSLRTGRKMWEVALGERTTGGPMLNESLGLVYLVMWSGRIIALDAHTGTLRWDAHLPGGSESSPALSQRLNMLYMGSFDGSFYALNARTGNLSWRYVPGGSTTASPVVVQIGEQNWVILASQNGSCQVVDANTGKFLYTWKLGELRADPIVAQGILYQASLGDTGLFAFRL